jgi:carotenoid cleavage dioxygenase-like enzyme
MRNSLLAVALVAVACPLLASAQDESPQVQSIRTDEQIILSQIMTDKRAVYAQAMKLTDEESRAFWHVYDEYEAKVKKIDDRFIQLVNDYAAKYSTMTDADAQQMLAAKMKLDRERMDLQQAYTKKIAKAVPAIKALRYAQVESRIDNELQRKVMQLIPIAP